MNLSVAQFHLALPSDRPATQRADDVSPPNEPDICDLELHPNNNDKVGEHQMHINVFTNAFSASI